MPDAERPRDHRLFGLLTGGHRITDVTFRERPTACSATTGDPDRR